MTPGGARLLRSVPQRAALCACLAFALSACAIDRLGEGTEADRISTGFAVSQDGHWLTAAHGVTDCAAILVSPELGDPVFAQIRAIDGSADLALLRTPTQANGAARIAASRPEEGAQLQLIGYPGRVEAPVVDVVTARYDPRAPIGRRIGLEGVVRPGHSGAPVLSDDGWVVGVAIQALDASVEATDETPDFGLAVDPALVVRFLEAQGLELSERTTGASRQVFSEAASRFLARVECYEPG
ncbi:MAG: serine protease [Pseudomonadota bacterium]